MRFKVWLVGHEAEACVVAFDVPPPVTSMNVKDFCCRTGVFGWKDYQRIRYRRMKNVE